MTCFFINNRVSFLHIFSILFTFSLNLFLHFPISNSSNSFIYNLFQLSIFSFLTASRLFFIFYALKPLFTRLSTSLIIC